MNQDRYDYFGVTYCCGNTDRGAGDFERAAGEKSISTLGSGSITSRFKSLSEKTVTKTAYGEPQTSYAMSSGLKVKLKKLATDQPITLKVNGTKYNCSIIGEPVGNEENATEKKLAIVYKDIDGEYVLDFKLVIELLNITQKEWNSINNRGTLEVEYCKAE